MFRRNEDSEGLNEQNKGKINQNYEKNDDNSKGGSDSGTLNVENNEQKFNGYLYIFTWGKETFLTKNSKKYSEE